MRIIIFIDKWDAGGIESYLLSHLKHIDRRGMDIEIVTSIKITNNYDDLIDSLGIKVKELLPKKKYTPLIRTMLLIKEFNKYIVNVNADIIHFNIYNAVSMIYCFQSRKHIRHRIIHSHNSSIEPSKGRALKILVHKLCRFLFLKYATNKWACSDLAGKWMFGENVEYEYIKNGVDVERFRFDLEKRNSFREKYNIACDEIILGNIGRMNTQKNQQFLIDVFNKYRENNKKTKLFIVGEGEQKEYLENKVNNLGLSEDIVFLGVVSEVAEFFSGIDIFCLPSLFEGNPVSAIEGQISGVKMLISDTITSNAVLLNETEKVSIDSMDTWVSRLNTSIVGTSDYRLGSISAVVRKGFSIEDTSKKLEENYRSIYGKNIN